MTAHAQDAFDEHGALIGELFAVPAAIAVENAHALAQTKRLASQLRAALTSRAVIDHAIGILIGRTGCNPDQAFERLRQLSTAENKKLHLIARGVVEQATRQARAEDP